MILLAAEQHLSAGQIAAIVRCGEETVRRSGLRDTSPKE
jgi:hypothetical protein